MSVGWTYEGTNARVIRDLAPHAAQNDEEQGKMLDEAEKYLKGQGCILRDRWTP